MAGDVDCFDPDTNEASMVFIKMTDDVVTDIYSFSERVDITTIK